MNDKNIHHQNKILQSAIQQHKDILHDKQQLETQLHQLQGNYEIRQFKRKERLQTLMSSNRTTSAPKLNVSPLSDKDVVLIFSYLDAVDILRLSQSSKAIVELVNRVLQVKQPQKSPQKNTKQQSQLQKADKIIKSLSKAEMKAFPDIMTRWKQLENVLATKRKI